MPPRTLDTEKDLSLSPATYSGSSPGCLVVQYPTEAWEDPETKIHPFYAAVGKCTSVWGQHPKHLGHRQLLSAELHPWDGDMRWQGKEDGRD